MMFFRLLSITQCCRLLMMIWCLAGTMTVTVPTFGEEPLTPGEPLKSVHDLPTLAGYGPTEPVIKVGKVDGQVFHLPPKQKPVPVSAGQEFSSQRIERFVCFSGTALLRFNNTDHLLSPYSYWEINYSPPSRGWRGGFMYSRGSRSTSEFLIPRRGDQIEIGKPFSMLVLISDPGKILPVGEVGSFSVKAESIADDKTSTLATEPLPQTQVRPPLPHEGVGIGIDLNDACPVFLKVPKTPTVPGFYYLFLETVPPALDGGRFGVQLEVEFIPANE